MQADAPFGVAGDVSRDDAGASREVAVESFWTDRRLLPQAHGSQHRGTRAGVYFSGKGSFCVEFGEFEHSTSIWTTEAGLERLIGSLQAALVRARIAREATA